MELDAEQLGQKLNQKTDMTPKQIRKQTKKTIQKHKPLITEKTSAIIYLAKQKNIDLIQTKPPKLDIENIVPEINNITIKCTIQNIDKFTYTKKGETKKGCDITLTDDTGKISMMIWGEQVKQIDQGLEGRKVKIKNTYSTEYKGETQLQYTDDCQIAKTK